LPHYDGCDMDTPTAFLREPFDYVLVGGGLQNALIAIALLRAHPNVRLALVERELEIGGNHVWCYHAGDLSPVMASLVAPMVVQRWDGYDVAFPAFERRLTEPYAAVSAAALASVVRGELLAHPSCALCIGRSAVHIGGDHVVLDDGAVLRAAVVVEALGPQRRTPGRGDGYQKFLGLELSLARPMGRDVPLVMDARVEQTGGFRFLYLLPLSATVVLAEETRFSDSPALDREDARNVIASYVSRMGLKVVAIRREEVGILPLPLRASSAVPRGKEGSFVAGYQGGWFHPVSAYSFPIAARLAEVVASAHPSELAAAWRQLWRSHSRQARFGYLLNRLFFLAFAERDRRNVIEGFYRLPAATIRRFYALSLTPMDCARILGGRAPAGFSFRRVLSGGRCE
jgi:lycopene beta-cyclase